MNFEPADSYIRQDDVLMLRAREMARAQRVEEAVEAIKTYRWSNSDRELPISLCNVLLLLAESGEVDDELLDIAIAKLERENALKKPFPPSYDARVLSLADINFGSSDPNGLLWNYDDLLKSIIQYTRKTLSK